MAKQMIVTLPLVMLLLDYWPLGRLAVAREMVRHRLAWLAFEKLPFVLLAIAAAAITLMAQQSADAKTLGLDDLSLAARLENAAVAYVAYLWACVWPTRLSFYYPHPALSGQHYAGWQVWGSASALIVISVGAIRYGRRFPFLPVGWFWFLITMLPVIGLVQVGQQAHADRFAYMTFLGLYLIVAWGLAELVSRYHLLRPVVLSATGLWLIGLSVLTFRQIGYWHDTRALCLRALDVNAENALAHNLLGVLLKQEGNLHEAKQHFTKAIGIRSAYATAHFNLATICHAQWQTDAAIRHYQSALAIDPSLLVAHLQLAKLLTASGRSKQAVMHFDHVLRHQPDNVEALNGLAWLLAISPNPQLRDGERAVRLAARACKLTRHELGTPIDTLAAAYAETGQFDRAISSAKLACKLLEAERNQQAAQESRERLMLYEQGVPYRAAHFHLGGEQ